jgi:cyclopropane fatty-acyl-phospholipid synthase-like methyltransferase
MMTRGEHELARFGDRFRYHDWDMNVGGWPVELSGPFDAVVSSAAIHHLDHDRKRWLARAVLDHLAPGGVFANYDLSATLRPPSAPTRSTIEHAPAWTRPPAFSTTPAMPTSW